MLEQDVGTGDGPDLKPQLLQEPHENGERRSGHDILPSQARLSTGWPAEMVAPVPVFGTRDKPL
jgi:hypothetical protein